MDTKKTKSFWHLNMNLQFSYNDNDSLQKNLLNNPFKSRLLALLVVLVLLYWQTTSLGADVRELTQLQNRYEQALKNDNYLKLKEVTIEMAIASEKFFGINSLKTADAVKRVARLYFFEKRYHQASMLLQRVEAIQRKILGDDHPDLALTINDLGQSTAQQFRYRSQHRLAEKLFKESIEMLKKSGEKAELDLTIPMGNLAEFYFDRKKIKEANNLYQQILDINLKNLGADHEQVAVARLNLARLEQSQGNFTESRRLFKEAAKHFFSNKQEDNESKAAFLIHYGDFYLWRGDFEEAKPLYKYPSSYLKVVGARSPGRCTTAYSIKLSRNGKGSMMKRKDISKRPRNSRWVGCRSS